MGRSGAAQVMPCEPNTLIGSLGIHFFLQSSCPLALEKSSSCFLNGWSDLGGNVKGTSMATADHLSEVFILFFGFCVSEFRLSLKKNLSFTLKTGFFLFLSAGTALTLPIALLPAQKVQVYVMNLTKATH